MPFASPTAHCRPLTSVPTACREIARASVVEGDCWSTRPLSQGRIDVPHRPSSAVPRATARAGPRRGAASRHRPPARPRYAGPCPVTSGMFARQVPRPESAPAGRVAALHRQVLGRGSPGERPAAADREPTEAVLGGNLPEQLRAHARPVQTYVFAADVASLRTAVVRPLGRTRGRELQKPNGAAGLAISFPR